MSLNSSFPRAEKFMPSIEDEERVFNIAGGYVYLKILRPLIYADIWETVARYGTEYIEESLDMDKDDKVLRRVEGLDRLKNCLLMIIDNSDFKIKTTRNKVVHLKFDRYEQRIINVVEPYLPYVSRVINNVIQKKQTTIINEDMFNQILKILRQIKRDMNKEINDAGLIFRQGETIDIDKLSEEIRNGG